MKKLANPLHVSDEIILGFIYMTDLIRVPAEWEDYNSVLIAWPHENTDWGGYAS